MKAKKVNVLLSTFIKGIYAGLAIGLGSLLYIISTTFVNKILGSILFAVGLFLVCTFGFFLYTGKIGYFSDQENKKQYSKCLIIGILGNLVGAVSLGFVALLFFDKVLHMENIMKTAVNACNSRLYSLDGSLNFFKSLVSSIICGMFVFLAVHSFKQKMFYPFRLLLLILCVFLFVYNGTEHCIANMFYFTMGKSWNWIAIINILIVIIGNSLGAILVNALRKA